MQLGSALVWSLFSLVWCGVVWCGVVWCGVVWCSVMWCNGVYEVIHWWYVSTNNSSLPPVDSLCR